MVDAVISRLSPFRASWIVAIAVGLLLILAGIYFLADGERAEFILGATISATLILDGVRLCLVGFTLSRSQKRDLTLVRGAIGILVGLPVIALSVTGQITVVGIRAVLGVGVLAYGLLGLWITRPSETAHDARWVPAGLDLLMIALGLLLIYRVVTSDSISLLLAVIGWLAIGSGVAYVAVGLVRRRRISDPVPEGQPPH
jgi:uncharacterized membrane protein HdeD (DUF308 family)